MDREQKLDLIHLAVKSILNKIDCGLFEDQEQRIIDDWISAPASFLNYTSPSDSVDTHFDQIMSYLEEIYLNLIINNTPE